MCGVQTNPSCASSGWSGGGGSFSKTSRAAPPRCPEASASARARSSTIPPRAQFTRIAPFFTFASVAASTRFRVCSVSGTWSEIASASRQSVSRSTRVAPSLPAASGVMKGS